jgi:hypothetical protein
MRHPQPARHERALHLCGPEQREIRDNSPKEIDMIDLDILVILDRSGSMESAKSDHEGGLRSFVDDQRSLPGEVRFTLVQFDTINPCEIVYDRVPIASVGTITLVPRGGTPLLDAMGLALAHLTTQHAADPARHTIVMVVTDGEENASKEWDLPRVKQLVTELETTGGQVLYLGANVDAFAEAGAVGVTHLHAMNYSNTSASVGAAYQVMTNKVSTARNLMRGGASGQSISASLAFTDEERDQVSTGTVVNTTKTSDDAA